MIEQVEEFVGLLRNNGVRVSTAEAIDASRALAAVGLERAEDVRAALAATLIKRASDRATFDELFAMYFLRGAAAQSRPHARSLIDMLAANGIDPDAIEHIVARLAGEAARLSAVARSALGLSALGISPLVRAAGVQADVQRMVSPLQAGYFSQRIAAALDLRGTEAQVDQLLRRLVGSGGLTAAQEGLIRELVAANLVDLRAAVRAYVNDQFHQRNLGLAEQVSVHGLAHKPLARLTDAEVAELRHEVERLAQLLRTRVQQTRKLRRRGRLDTRRTLRDSLATGGIPFSLHYRCRARKKPQLVVLCDISDSVRNVSRFMLLFVYTLQELFDRVHTFAFVSELGDMTELFRRHELERAVELAYQGAIINVFANSNYGRVLQQFQDRHMGKITPRTTVLMIGDGRNNYHASHHAVLGDIRRRAKQVLWINPEAPAAWGFGDSAMRDYAPHCSKVVVAHNLDSLRRVVDELVL
jgi:uncharacterized protein